VKNLLHRNETFRGLWIGRGMSIHWPPRSPHLTPLDLCLWILMKSGVYERKLNSPDGWLWHLYVAGCIKKREDQLKWTARDFHTRVAKCTEVDGGIFEHLLWIV